MLAVGERDVINGHVGLHRAKPDLLESEYLVFLLRFGQSRRKTPIPDLFAERLSGNPHNP
jgi:hypothetical protein